MLCGACTDGRQRLRHARMRATEEAASFCAYEVEEVLRLHPGVADLVAALVPHPAHHGAVVGVAYVPTNAACHLTAAELSAFGSVVLAPFMLPQLVMRCPTELPATRPEVAALLAQLQPMDACPTSPSYEQHILQALHALGLPVHSGGGLEDAPLMQLGVDSLNTGRLVQLLNTALAPRLALRPTVVFDHPTIRQLASYIHHELCAPSELPRRVEGTRATTAPHAMRLAGSAMRLPGGVARAASLQELCASAGDGMQQRPTGRVAAALPSFGERMQSAPLTAASYGGYVYGAEYFDAASFVIPAGEVWEMDPQQRLLLELGYASLHDAGQRRERLVGCRAAVFVGLMNADFAIHADLAARRRSSTMGAGSSGYGSSSGSVYAATGSQGSVASGRLSFVLGMQGPAATIDTACSSSLLALHLARISCERATAAAHDRHPPSLAALVAAANLILVPNTTLTFARAGMLSADGRCKTFDARANGYARSEAIGAVAVEEAGGAEHLEVGGGILLHEGTRCFIGSSAAHSDGKSASLTAPNGTSQARLVRECLGSAGLTILAQVETHGTGTALGDPTEAGGLERALGAIAPILGSLKANLGHAEPSAALASILMVRMALNQLAAVGNGNAQLRVCNVMVEPALRGMRAQLPTQRLAASARARHVGVSSFGYSGTIAHVVLLCDATALLGPRHCTQPPCLRFRRRAFPWWPEAAPPSAPTERPAAGRMTSPFAPPICDLLGASPPPLADHFPSVTAPLPPPTTASPLVEQLALQAEASAELSLLALGALDTRGRERGRDLGTRADCLLMNASKVAISVRSSGLIAS